MKNPIHLLINHWRKRNPAEPAFTPADPAPDSPRPLTELERQQLLHMFRNDWNAVTLETTLKYGWGQNQIAFAQAAKACQWQEVLAMLETGAGNPNSYQLDQPGFNTALHYAAADGAPREVIEKLIEWGGWRTLPNAQGKRPLDLAIEHGHQHLLGMLLPQLLHDVEWQRLQLIQFFFHRFLGESELVSQHHLRLPELSVLLELPTPKMWFPVPGQYGNCIYWLDMQREQPVLITESTCRIVGGPVPRREISEFGVKPLPSVRNQ